MSLKKILLGAVKGIAWGALGCASMLIVVVVLVLEDRPDLKVWHTAKLDAEFREDSEVRDFEAYLALEERLWAQLEEQVCARVEAGDRSQINRFNRGSRSDPNSLGGDWNRSFELEHDRPRVGVLAIHGLSDSPYTMRETAQRMHAAGAWVVGLRLPGHGTAPSGLLQVTWEDWAAAVRLAARHLREKVGDRPLYLVGHSTGAALALQYSLDALEDGSLPSASGLMMMSPAIGVTRSAALAIWQARLGRLLGMRKLGWNSIGPEYDPFKYGSFAVNAGHQIYRLTTEIRARLANSDRLGELPPVLAFQSAVDATVSTPVLVSELMKQLPVGGHELVVVDINRLAEIEHLLKSDPRDPLADLLRDQELTFTLTVITNENDESNRLIVHSHAPGQDPTAEPLGLEWPPDLFSLAHVALPFPPNDPVYGNEVDPAATQVQLGRVALRGENGLLLVSPSAMLRLRWNPFYPYMIQRMLAFGELEP